MNKNKRNTSARWFYLAVGVIAMLFAGVLYAWSILKAPLAADFGWGPSQLALNFPGHELLLHRRSSGCPDLQAGGA